MIRCSVAAALGSLLPKNSWSRILSFKATVKLASIAILLWSLIFLFGLEPTANLNTKRLRTDNDVSHVLRGGVINVANVWFQSDRKTEPTTSRILLEKLQVHVNEDAVGSRKYISDDTGKEMNGKVDADTRAKENNLNLQKDKDSVTRRNIEKKGKYLAKGQTGHKDGSGIEQNNKTNAGKEDNENSKANDSLTHIEKVKVQGENNIEEDKTKTKTSNRDNENKKGQISESKIDVQEKANTEGYSDRVQNIDEGKSIMDVKTVDTVTTNSTQTRKDDDSIINAGDTTHLTTIEPATFIPKEADTSPLHRPPTIPKKFVIEEPDYCHRRPGLQIISYIHSAIKRVKERMETRHTWANASAYDMGVSSVSVGAVFMVGAAKDEEEQKIIQEESERYHDIVQGNYGDHYRLLTYKSLAGLYWINSHCSHVPWTLHADDDLHMDIFLFHQALKRLDEVSRGMFVCSFMYGPVLREGRYAVRREEFSAEEYPLYCSGGAWMLQTALIPRLLKASTTVDFLWVDDAYVTGRLAERAGIKQHPFQDYYGGPDDRQEEIGKKVVWFYKNVPRLEWWQRIVDYHRNHSMLQPATLPPSPNN